MKALALAAALVTLGLAVMLGSSAMPASAATTIAVDCTADPGALASALAVAADGDTLAIQGTCRGTFEIAHSLILTGSGGATLDGQGAGTVLTVDSGTTVSVTGLTITNGFAFVGGGIINQGTLTLSNSTVSGSSTSFAGAGGGIVNGGSGTLTLNDSTVSSNTASFAGGIYNFGPLTLNGSAITGNTGNPGGILNNASGNVTVSGSTLSDNSGSGLQNVFGGTVTLNGTTVSGNSGPYAALNNAGALTVADSTVSGNSSSFAAGGGIANAGGTLTVSRSTVKGNSTSTSGGGISNTFNGNARISESTISGNSATSGGGVDNEPSSVLTLANDTITANSASDSGGGIYVTGFSTMTLNYDTITANSANVSGGGVFVSGFTASVAKNTIVADQTAGGDCAGTISDGGYNIDGEASCGFSTANNSLPNTDPLLDPAGLKDNGGPTQTIALQPGSPAIDAIPGGVNDCGTAITSDQRGVSRPQGAGCDIGAFELVPRQTVTVQIDIEPGAFPNVIDLGSKGKIPVAVLSTADFNAPQQVDTASLKFGRTGNEASLAFCSAPQDVNGDGLPDVVCHFSVRKTGFQLGDTEGVLTGSTVGGVPIRGTDSVVVVSSS